MKKRILGLVLAPALVLGFTGCATCSHSTAWEYKVAIVSGNMVATNNVPVAEETINNMTQQGWHLVSVSAGGSDPKVVLVFKRHK